jgi:hypothetical protein
MGGRFTSLSLAHTESRSSKVLLHHGKYHRQAKHKSIDNKEKVNDIYAKNIRVQLKAIKPDHQGEGSNQYGQP